MSEAKQSGTDFRIADAVTVRVAGSTPADVSVVRRQLGHPAGPGVPGAPADIVVRFVDRLDVGRSLRFVGLDDAAFTDDSFFVLRGRQKSRILVSIPLDRAGAPLEIEAERGARAIPFLVPLVNLAALGHGIVPIHASAIRHEGRGILVTGWSKGGKTETVLSAMAAGAAFVGDEWVYLDSAGVVRGLGEPVRIWDWQLAQLPDVRRRVSAKHRLRLRATALAADSVGMGRRTLRRSPLASVLDRAEPVVRRQLSVQVTPDRLWARSATETPVDAVVLAMSTAESAVRATRVDTADTIARMVESNDHERLDLLALYRKFRFAFPGRRSTILEGAAELEANLLHQRLGSIPAFRLDHPYPPDLRSLFPALDAALRSAADGADAQRKPDPAADGGTTSPIHS